MKLSTCLSPRLSYNHIVRYSTRIQHGAIGPLYVTSSYSTWIFCRGVFRLCNWLSLRRLVSWIQHLPPECWSTFWKSIFKQQLDCRFDIMDSISSFFCILTYAIIYVLMHYIIFWRYLYFLMILYFFKYSCTNILHRNVLSIWIKWSNASAKSCVVDLAFNFWYWQHSADGTSNEAKGVVFHSE